MNNVGDNSPRFSAEDAKRFGLLWGRASIRRRMTKGYDNRTRMMWLRGSLAMSNAEKLRRMADPFLDERSVA